MWLSVCFLYFAHVIYSFVCIQYLARFWKPRWGGSLLPKMWLQSLILIILELETHQVCLGLTITQIKWKGQVYIWSKYRWRSMTQGPRGSPPSWVAFAFDISSFLYFIRDCTQRHFLSISWVRHSWCCEDGTVESMTDVGSCPREEDG